MRKYNRPAVTDIQLNDKDIQMLGVDAVVTKDAGSVLLGDEGNAGTLYMTINPNTVDFTGLNVSLVNSQDEFSGAELSGLAPSNEVLSFGYTRAKKNGFYEAKATISEKSLEDVKLSMNFNEIKEVAKDIVNGGSVDVNKVASTVADAMSAFVMDYDYGPDLETLKATHYNFYKTIRDAHPNIPIVMITKPIFTPEPTAADLERVAVIKDTYIKALEANDENVYFINGNTVFPAGAMHDLFTIDNEHLTDAGMFYMAMSVYDALAEGFSKAAK